ncbi:hypothetical protein SODALDRAFT_374785 [Sodiomyces alkalinus F11]|uniref:Uncharacterized protein n=1 Tax=Sodiomyces alkalinus (strain CBS 110278 / VKM F-3762 / F11) TaxID=1314773 RepID=A0A3N2Q765_SODAK|nr:hypothetical protein SODALDRAFT_374785 [Sodiomyces alkalinus F11]ROT42455.1 hypothetical protein SODALDRAFT_374785 [Sodiomyces alkalinus F11]
MGATLGTALCTLDSRLVSPRLNVHILNPRRLLSVLAISDLSPCLAPIHVSFVLVASLSLLAPGRDVGVQRRKLLIAQALCLCLISSLPVLTLGPFFFLFPVLSLSRPMCIPLDWQLRCSLLAGWLATQSVNQLGGQSQGLRMKTRRNKVLALLSALAWAMDVGTGTGMDYSTASTALATTRQPPEKKTKRGEKKTKTKPSLCALRCLSSVFVISSDCVVSVTAHISPRKSPAPPLASRLVLSTLAFGLGLIPCSIFPHLLNHRLAFCVTIRSSTSSASSGPLMTSLRGPCADRLFTDASNAIDEPNPADCGVY